MTETSKTQRKRAQREQATATYKAGLTTPPPPTDPTKPPATGITAFTRTPMNRAWRRQKQQPHQ